MPGPAMQLQTMQVYWAKFGAEPVTINAADFDAAVHRRLEDGPAPTASVPVVTREVAPVTMTGAAPASSTGPAPRKRGKGQA
jgi:hypothetical protein